MKINGYLFFGFFIICLFSRVSWGCVGPSVVNLNEKKSQTLSLTEGGMILFESDLNIPEIDTKDSKCWEVVASLEPGSYAAKILNDSKAEYKLMLRHVVSKKNCSKLGLKIRQPNKVESYKIKLKIYQKGWLKC
jgi:hypothetical protein